MKAGPSNVDKIHLARKNFLSVDWQAATQTAITGGLACYVLLAMLWIITLSRVDVSIAYPILSLDWVVTAFGACHLFGKALSIQRLLVIFVIPVGVSWLALP